MFAEHFLLHNFYSIFMREYITNFVLKFIKISNQKSIVVDQKELEDQTIKL